ncbi:MAG: UvrB/UvrC motif-containing protein [Candidatus Yanofskybacteria bacterium]|nr:UvrB/UvrC motif-containing protein [Candidatus Yanofskybacteria bacterium]
MTSDSLQSATKTAPKTPGVYTFRNSKGRPLYIGKAANLKSRILSYLKSNDSRIRKMIEFAREVTFEQTSSDIEALILESQRIKKQQPPFNIMLRDDKQYFYVAFTKEQYPKIHLTHQFKTNKIKKDITELIGPFTDGSALKVTLKLLRRLFPYCTCKQPHYVRCLNAHIGKCLGFCCLRKPKDPKPRTYTANIRAIKNILNGKRDDVVSSLEKEMAQFAKHGNFEKAIELRDKIEKIKRVFLNAQIIRNQPDNVGVLTELQQALKLDRLPLRIEGYDISNIQGAYATGSMVVFVQGIPDKNEYRKFKIRSKQTADDTAMLREVLSRRLNHPEWTFPDLIIVDGGKGQLNAATAAIHGTCNTKHKNHLLHATCFGIHVIALTKNDKHFGDHIYVTSRKIAIPLSRLSLKTKNLILGVDTEAHRFAISYYRKLHGRSLRLRS